MITDIASTLIAAGVLGCLGYLRRISKQLAHLERTNFTQDLHILDHERRLDALESLADHHSRKVNL